MRQTRQGVDIFSIRYDERVMVYHRCCSYNSMQCLHNKGFVTPTVRICMGGGGVPATCGSTGTYSGWCLPLYSDTSATERSTNEK